MKRNLPFLLVLVLLLGACSSEDDDNTRTPQEQLAFDIERIQGYISENQLEDFQVTSSGLHYRITEQGNGVFPPQGSTVSVEYIGRNIRNVIFDQSPAGQPFTFVVGAGQVIAGWDEGIPLLSVGGSGTFIIPSGLAYGNQALGANIGRNEILIFEVKLLDVR